MDDCGICGKKFSSKGNLNQHVRQVHNKERNYRCEDCGRTFSMGNDMRKHRGKVHEVHEVHEVYKLHTVTTYTKTETRVETKTYLKTKVVTTKSRGSKGEKDVEDTLRGYRIRYIKEKTFDGLVGLGGGLLRYDFAIAVDTGCSFLLIEYDGEQHFRPTQWGSTTVEEVEETTKT